MKSFADWTQELAESQNHEPEPKRPVYAEFAEELDEVQCSCGAEYGPPNADDGRRYCNRYNAGNHCAP